MVRDRKGQAEWRFRRDFSLLIETGDQATLDQIVRTVTSLARMCRVMAGAASRREAPFCKIGELERHAALIEMFGECVGKPCPICAQQDDDAAGGGIEALPERARDIVTRTLRMESDEWRALAAYRMQLSGVGAYDIANRLGMRMDEIAPLIEYAALLRIFCQTNADDFWAWLEGSLQ